MRIDVKETKVYPFDELSAAAKETARQWWRDCENQDFGGCGFELEFAETAAKLLGIEFDTRPVKLVGSGTRYDSVIYWSGFYSQGDGASFKGRYSFAADSPAKVRAEFPKDEKLHRIADELAELQAKNSNSLTGKIEQRGNYVHSNTMYVYWVEREDEKDVSNDAEDELQDLMRDFANWIYANLREDYEWQMADEQVDDSIRGNEYKFTENGKIY